MIAKINQLLQEVEGNCRFTTPAHGEESMHLPSATTAVHPVGSG